MKIAAVLDGDNNLSPLDMGEKISIIDTEKKEITEYENPGYQRPHGGKEVAMSVILNIKPDAIAVKEGFLCPGSYRMSINKIKYLLTESSDLEGLISELGEVDNKLVEDISAEIFRE